jgi:hypothetical protein
MPEMLIRRSDSGSISGGQNCEKFIARKVLLEITRLIERKSLIFR